MKKLKDARGLELKVGDKVIGEYRGETRSFRVVELGRKLVTITYRDGKTQRTAKLPADKVKKLQQVKPKEELPPEIAKRVERFEVGMKVRVNFGARHRAPGKDKHNMFNRYEGKTGHITNFCGLNGELACVIVYDEEWNGLGHPTIPLEHLKRIKKGGELVYRDDDWKRYPQLRKNTLGVTAFTEEKDGKKRGKSKPVKSGKTGKKRR